MINKTASVFKEYKRGLTAALYGLFSLIILLMSWEAHYYYPQMAVADTAPVVSYNWPDGEDSFIPEESIRLRIKSNSQAPLDLRAKLAVRNEVNRTVTEWTSSLESLDQARGLINSRMGELENVVDHVLDEMGVHTSFNVALKKTEFPVKQYGERLYPAGTYEAVYIELGDGLGDNWWCVLFPPLCFVETAAADSDKSVEYEEESDKEEVTVSFFIVEVMQSLWKKFS